MSEPLLPVVRPATFFYGAVPRVDVEPTGPCRSDAPGKLLQGSARWLRSVCLRQSEAVAGPRQRSAADRVLCLPELIENIAAYCAFADLGILAEVNHFCSVVLSGPALWQRLYRPAKVDWAAREVQTLVDLRSGYWPLARPHWGLGPSRVVRDLGTYRGKVWRLRFEPWREDAYSPRPEVLPKEERIALAMGLNISSDNRHWVEQNSGDLLYPFLFDRAYRLRTGQAVATFRPDGLLALALTPVILSLWVGAFLCLSTAKHTEPSARKDHDFIGGMIAFMAGNFTALFLFETFFGLYGAPSGFWHGASRRRALDAAALRLQNVDVRRR